MSGFPVSGGGSGSGGTPVMVPVAGLYYAPLTHLSGATSNPGANVGYAVPFINSFQHSYQGLAAWSGGDTIGAAFNMALYADNGVGYPGALVSGSSLIGVSNATHGGNPQGFNAASFTAAIAMAPGLYWIVLFRDTSQTAPLLNTGQLVSGANVQSLPSAAAVVGFDNTGGGGSCTGFAATSFGTGNVFPASYPASAPKQFGSFFVLIQA